MQQRRKLLVLGLLIGLGFESASWANIPVNTSVLKSKAQVAVDAANAWRESRSAEIGTMGAEALSTPAFPIPSNDLLQARIQALPKFDGKKTAAKPNLLPKFILAWNSAAKENAALYEGEDGALQKLVLLEQSVRGRSVTLDQMRYDILSAYLLLSSPEYIKPSVILDAMTVNASETDWSEVALESLLYRIIVAVHLADLYKVDPAIAWTMAMSLESQSTMEEFCLACGC